MRWLDLTMRPTYWKCFTRSSVVLRSFLPLTLASLGVNKDPLGAGVEAELGSGRDTPAGMSAAPLGGFLPGIAAAWPRPHGHGHVPGPTWTEAAARDERGQEDSAAHGRGCGGRGSPWGPGEAAPADMCYFPQHVVRKISKNTAPTTSIL